MTNKIKLLVGKILNKKTIVDLDNDGKIESYREEIQGVFSQFKRMHGKLSEVNEKLITVVEDETKIKLQADKRIEKANDEIQMNNKLQLKLDDFII